MDYNKNIETTVSKKQYENETNYLNKVYKFRNNKNYDPKYKNIKNQQGKNLKNLMLDANDLLTYNNYNNIEAGPSVLPKIKYCDITGFRGKYYDKTTKLRYFNSDIYKIVSTLPEPLKNQYLTIRKALFILK